MTLAQEIYSDYLQIFEELWGLAPERSVILGEHGNGLFEAEYKEHGADVYEYSIIQPIRNAWYNCSVMQPRWDHWLSKLNLDGPILDYGCGVGFQLAWLDEYGHEDLYGLDMGMNMKVLREMAKRRPALKPIVGGTPILTDLRFGTIFCVHVLEHVPFPMDLLEDLRGLLAPGGKLWAGCVLDEGHGHVAARGEREKVIESLRAEGELIEWQASPSQATG